MIVLLALVALTGCQTTTVKTDKAAIQILISQIPDLPEYPRWPDVSWSFNGSDYCLDEAEVDSVLDYLENGIPTYEFEINRYKEQLKIVFDGILSL